MFWMLTFYELHGSHIFSPVLYLGRLFSCFLCSAEALQFDVAPVVYFWFCCLFGVSSRKWLPRRVSRSLFSLFSSRSFTTILSLLWVLGAFVKISWLYTRGFISGLSILFHCFYAYPFTFSLLVMKWVCCRLHMYLFKKKKNPATLCLVDLLHPSQVALCRCPEEPSGIVPPVIRGRYSRGACC